VVSYAFSYKHCRTYDQGNGNSYKKNQMSTDRESGRGNKRARVTRGSRKDQGNENEIILKAIDENGKTPATGLTHRKGTRTCTALGFVV
jgi:hypothetical protein